MGEPASADAVTVIEVVKNGPYRVSGPCRVVNARGEDVAARGRFVLCRCGSSSTKPFCDGTHRRIGFDGTRFTEVAPEAAEPYRGRRITIHDNRALCAHSGVCTDSLPGVFRLGGAPWIDADGAEAAAVIDIVRRCPSGALSVTLEGEPPPAGAAEPLITASANGPYYVRGRVELKAGSARSRDPARYALCRCGGSKNKPFCDGTHWAIRFDESRGRQAGMFAVPFGFRRLGLALGALLVGATAAAFLAIEATGRWTAKGFIGPATLASDLNLVLEALLVAGLTLGGWLAKRGNIAAHRANQTIWVLVNAALVALIMARGMDNAALESVSDLRLPHLLVPWLHAALGAATVAAGLWLVLQMNGLLPRKLHVRRWKALMRATLAGYWAVAVLGVVIYYLWFLS
jgi:CDGSH-type Zn-finger protein/uncharacterized membrane protein YozB (DUF420 family)